MVNEIHKKEYKITEHTNFRKNIKILHLKGSNVQQLLMTVGNGMYRKITFDHICTIGGHLQKKVEVDSGLKFSNDVK